MYSLLHPPRSVLHSRSLILNYFYPLRLILFYLNINSIKKLTYITYLQLAVVIYILLHMHVLDYRISPRLDLYIIFKLQKQNLFRTYTQPIHYSIDYTQLMRTYRLINYIYMHVQSTKLFEDTLKQSIGIHFEKYTLHDYLNHFFL